MCGINGFTWKDRDAIGRMNAATAHRGPDATGVYFDDGISLGHNRLAIIDLSEDAAQPMTSADGLYTIVYNGELYNFEELRRELYKDWRFKSRSDTEVIMAAYAKWGKECLSRFNGMFAFAIWDKKRRELFLARDQIGIKPLYYFYDGNKFIFSSEIKAILEHDIPRTLNREAFALYMRVLYAPEPHTLFEYIKKLPPGCYATLKGPGLHIQKYWRVESSTPLRSQKLSGNFEADAKVLKDTVEQAVARQLVSDRPVGVYLSGGLDSSIVLASVAAAHGSIDTFSVGFELDPSEESDKFNKDAELAERTAEFFSSRHHEVKVAPADIVPLLEKAVFHLDDPISNPTAIAQIALAAYTKNSVAVALSGDGGDELFGGYERYRLSRLASLYGGVVPGFARSALSWGEEKLFHKDRLEKLATKAGVDRFGLFLFQKDATLLEILEEEYAGDTARHFFEKQFFSTVEKDFERQFMNADRQSWLVDECLIRGDKMSMASGLEMRVPLLDREVVEYAWQLPTSSKVSTRENKIILRAAFKERLPEYLFTEPKRGWFSPAAKWLRRKEMNQFLEEVLNPAYHPKTASLFDWEGVSTMLAAHKNKEKYNLTMLWALLTFQLWAKRYKVEL